MQEFLDKDHGDEIKENSDNLYQYYFVKGHNRTYQFSELTAKLFELMSKKKNFVVTIEINEKLEQKDVFLQTK